MSESLGDIIKALNRSSHTFNRLREDASDRSFAEELARSTEIANRTRLKELGEMASDNKHICQDDHEHATGTGRYSSTNPMSFNNFVADPDLGPLSPSERVLAFAAWEDATKTERLRWAAKVDELISECTLSSDYEMGFHDSMQELLHRLFGADFHCNPNMTAIQIIASYED